MRRKIYTSFEELCEANRSLFKFFRKGGYLGLLKGVWSARQAEIDHLRQKIKIRNDEISALEKDAGTRESHIGVLERELAEKKMIFLQRGKELDKTKGMLAEKDRQLSKELLRYQKLEQELFDAQAYIRTQKSLNEEMSSELLKATRYLEGASVQEKYNLVNQL